MVLSQQRSGQMSDSFFVMVPLTLSGGLQNAYSYFMRDGVFANAQTGNLVDAYALYPDCSLADLYDEIVMPPKLRRAHQQNDRPSCRRLNSMWRRLPRQAT